jgi:NAD(P)-dependent dehydrogenase (short-subunit alcohol dehydrogenase family)
MGTLTGRVAIITGAGRGIGREHALLFAREGAYVVVNDLGGANDGTGSDLTPAQEVVQEIEAMGGAAVANYDNVADWNGAQRLINQAVETFGALHVLVNNAGILRDRTLVNMTEDEWDAVINVHLKGHFLPTKFAAMYWRDQHKSGNPIAASVINTASTSGLYSNPGQSNYGAAKSGIATFTEIVQKELDRYGVRVNAISPAARTRLTLSIPGSEGRFDAKEGFDPFDPANISPFVAYLATADCPIKGRNFFVYGDGVHLFHPWAIVDSATNGGARWTVEELQQAAAKFADVPFNQPMPIRSTEK